MAIYRLYVENAKLYCYNGEENIPLDEASRIEGLNIPRFKENLGKLITQNQGVKTIEVIVEL